MQAHGQTPNSVTFTNVLPACARLGSLRPGKEIHARTIRMGSANDIFVSNALTDMYAKCGYLNLARNVFNISLRDGVSYNILIVGYSQTSDCSESLCLFSEMRHIGKMHDIVSFVGVISACANLAAIKQGKEIHGLLVRKLIHAQLFIANSLLDFYIKCGRIDIASKVFDQIQKKDVASWNTMILGYGMLGELDTAINLFEAMREYGGVEYDSISYIAVLSACSHGGLVEKRNKYFEEMQTQNIKPTQMHYACMVDLLGRAGLMEEAVELIKGLPIVPDANVWGALLGACRIYGNVELGCWAAEHLFKLKPQHCGCYILLSNMYAEAGRWEEANRVRDLMKSRGVKKNPGYSWVQIRDQVHAFVVGERIEGLDSDIWLAECS
jgi:pentatricopeptide repeat protein